MWERDHLEDTGLDGRIILKWNFRTGVDWIDLAQDRDKWRALVNAVRNIWVPQMFDTFMQAIMYLLTPWSTVLLEKPSDSQLVKILWNPNVPYRVYLHPS